MSDYGELQKRCQRGAANLNDANNMLAECYGMLGKLGAERDSASKHWENESNNFQALFAEVVRLKAENEALRQENERLREGRPVYKSAFYKFPEKLLRLRLEKGLSQRDLSALTGMSCPLISMYETGRTKPGMKNILRLEKALDCPGAFQGTSHD